MFHIGQNSLDVCKAIVENQPEISKIRLIAHEVEINWRQKYTTPEAKRDKLIEGFHHPKPLDYRIYTRDAFQGITMNELSNLPENHVWSITSNVVCVDGKTKHIPMMNFHPEHGSEKDVTRAIAYTCGNQEGVLVNSGRFQHYYGNSLMKEREWQQFMADFLMPTMIVSPRYIGHRLHAGYATLRLTADSKFKPKVPCVVEIF